ncbi:MAG: putative sulfate exporter family transporter, partial [Peptostreptococcus sp.]|nr:putative sulfate exporter family transporter [Peptostreptococcus sp.]
MGEYNVNKENIKGIIFCLLMAIPAWFLGKIMPIIGGPVFSILIGILVAGLLKDGKKTFQPGINFVSKKVLQYAVILLGFGLNLQMIIRVGKISIPIIISTIATSLIVSYILCRALNIPRKISILVGVGSSICGGSAIAATAPVVDADSDEVAQAISVIFFFNIIAALIFPILGDILGLSNSGFAVFAGTAINDTSSVTAAASSWDSIHKTGSAVLDSATIVKLTRTLAIIPITFCLSLYETKMSGVEEGKKINFLAMLPRFI